MMNEHLQNIVSNLLLLTPQSKEEMTAQICKILSNDLIEVIDSHNTASVVYVFGEGSDKYVIKAECGEIDATNREVSWYRAVSSESPTPTCYYAHKGEDLSFIVLRYIENAVTLDDVLASSQYTDDNLLHYLDLVIAKLRDLYAKSNPVKITDYEANEFLLRKLDSRIEKYKNFPFLKELYDADKITINGRQLPTPKYYVEKIKSNPKLYDLLTPKKAGLIHGDLHFGNILVSKDQLYFIDQNTATYIPIEYDYGKLLNTVHGGYGQIMQGAYTLTRNEDGTFTYHLDTPARRIVALDHLKATLPEEDLLRGMYIEALHFGNMLPNHAPKPEEATILFLRNVEIFHDLFNQERVKSLL